MAHRLSNYQGVQRTVLHRGAHQCSMMQHGHVSKAHCRVEWRPRTRRWFPRKDRPLRGLPTKTPQSCPSLGAEKFCSNEDESLGSDAQSTLGLIALQDCVQHMGLAGSETHSNRSCWTILASQSTIVHQGLLGVNEMVFIDLITTAAEGTECGQSNKDFADASSSAQAAAMLLSNCRGVVPLRTRQVN